MSRNFWLVSIVMALFVFGAIVVIMVVSQQKALGEVGHSTIYHLPRGHQLDQVIMDQACDRVVAVLTHNTSEASTPMDHYLWTMDRDGEVQSPPQLIRER